MSPRISAACPADKYPSAIEPLKPALVRSPPVGDQWLHEIKYDGYRMVCFLSSGQVKLQTKNGHDWSAKFPELVQAVKSLPARSAVLDCEMCALLPSGVSSMEALKATMGKASHKLVLFAFDLLYLDGRDLRQKPLLDRKQLLAELLGRSKSSRLQYVDHFQGDPRQLLCHCDQMGIEGLVSKRVDSQYVAGRSDYWLKTKCNKTGQFVIGGFTRPKGSKIELESLLVGERQPNGDLIYVGSVKVGLSSKLLEKWGARLEELGHAACPFTHLTLRSAPKRSVWVRPELLTTVRYLERTQNRSLRHAALLKIEG
jgi:bifunctional non-homologous end joining protein LigD